MAQGAIRSVKYFPVTIGATFILCLTFGSHAQQSDTITAERMDAHTVFFVYEGKQYAGFDLERSKELKKAENDAVAYKSELQDERVKYGKLNQLYDEQSKLFTSCMALSKNGSGINNKWLRFGLDVAPTVVTLAKPCH
jgi:hypothetical protein